MIANTYVVEVSPDIDNVQKTGDTITLDLISLIKLPRSGDDRSNRQNATPKRDDGTLALARIYSTLVL